VWPRFRKATRTVSQIDYLRKFAGEAIRRRRTDAGVLEVVLAHGERVVIRAGASGDLVRQVVAALRASC